ncbi:hypothetical protein [Bacteroides graminisolvens]|uniref:hypothetical protein n=1 Tax=Bacteroides graminisolvens TaxID=477666 RepID=UPI0029C9058E|nr:hypothetical protein [Bacteroides graminisolvens]
MIAWIIYTVIALVVVLYCLKAKTIGHVPDFRKPFSLALLGVYTTIMLVCCSCRSSNPVVQTDTQIEGTENTKEVKVSSDSTSLTVSRDVKWMKEWMNNFSFDFSKLETNWSAPDSTGKQYPTSTSETTGKASSQSKGTEQFNDNSVLQYQRITHAIDSLRKRVEMLIKQDQSPVPVEKKLNWWQTTLIWTGGIAWIADIIYLFVWMNKRTNWMSRLLGLIKKL